MHLLICVFFAIQCNFIVFGNMGATYNAAIGESLSIRIESPDGWIDSCFVRPPFETAAFINIINGNHKSEFEYTGTWNNSCSFKILQITKNFFGTWHVASRYSRYIQDDNLTEYLENTQSFNINKTSIRSYESEIGESLRITVPSHNKPIAECLIHRPVDQGYFGLFNLGTRGDLQYAGAHDRSCSINITNVTDSHIGRWHVYTSYYPHPDNSTLELENPFSFEINGIEKRTLQVTMGKSLPVNTFSRINTKARCFISAPRDVTYYSSLNDEKWKSKIEFFGEKDNSCSFKFVNVTDDIVGNWLLTSVYVSDYDATSFYKDLVLSVNEKIKSVFHGRIGGFVEINIPSPRGKTIDCKVLRPGNKWRQGPHHQGETWLDITEEKKKISLKRVENNDNSCSIKILNLSYSSFGKWQIITVYENIRNVKSYEKNNFTLINAQSS